VVLFLYRLKTGWSVKTQKLQSFGGRQDSALNETEQTIIKDVIKRAEMLEVTEQERVGYALILSCCYNMIRFVYFPLQEMVVSSS
jgi:hypothetical protein